MGIDGFRADTKGLGNLPVVQASGEILKNFKFAFRQLASAFRFRHHPSRRRGNDFVPLHDAGDRGADFFRRLALYKQTVNTGLLQLPKQNASRATRNNGKTGFRGPAFCLEENLKTVRPGHGKIKQGAVRLVGLDERDCFNPVLGNRGHFKIGKGLNGRTHPLGNERVIIRNDNCLGHISPGKRPFLTMLIACFLIVIPVCNTAIAQGSEQPPLSLEGPIDTSDVSPRLHFYLDTDWEKTVAEMAGEDARLFQPNERSEPDFGYTKSRIWLRLRLRNDTADEEKWRLHFKENFVQNFDVYVLRADGSLEHTVSLDRRSPFQDRPVPFPELVAPLEISSGESATILISYWSEGSSHLHFSIETLESFASRSMTRGAKNFIYYGMMVILIIGALAALVIMRQKIFLAYAAYAGFALLFVMHADGSAFQLLWPHWPLFNSYASIVLGGGFAVASTTYARVYLQTKDRHPVLDKALKSVGIFVALMAMSAFFLDPQFIKQALVSTAFLSLVLCALAGIIVARTRFREVRFYVLAWLGAVISSLIMNLRHIGGLDLPQDLEFDSIRFAMVFDAAMMGLAIADRYNQLRRSRQKAMEKNLADTQRNLDLSSRLHDLEEQYQLAVELVQSRDQEMRNTVHDLRQPLHALRLNIHKLKQTGKNPAGPEDNIDETFTYLENLIADHLRGSITPATPAEVDKDSPDAIGMPRVLLSIHEMFLPDAENKGLSFRYLETSLTAEIDPLVLMRIVTNLVSNAIKYTKEGGILMLARKSGGAIHIEVHDTGPGMSEADFEWAQQREVRLKDAEKQAEGHGYGLAIARNLAIENGLKLRLAPNRRNGTGVILEIPFTE